jgi:hypothetical protein
VADRRRLKRAAGYVIGLVTRDARADRCVVGGVHLLMDDTASRDHRRRLGVRFPISMARHSRLEYRTPRSHSALGPRQRISHILRTKVAFGVTVHIIAKLEMAAL